MTQTYFRRLSISELPDDYVENTIGYVRNGQLSDYQIQDIKRYLGDSLETDFFIGESCGYLEKLTGWQGRLEPEIVAVSDAFRLKEQIVSLLEYLDHPMPEVGEIGSHGQNVLSKLLPHNRQGHLTETMPGYVNVDVLKGLLETIVANIDKEKLNPVYPLAQKRRGNRANIELEFFCREIVSSYKAAFDRLPRLSEGGPDFQALAHLLDAYGYTGEDQLKPLKKAAKHYRDIERSQVKKGNK